MTQNDPKRQAISSPGLPERIRRLEVAADRICWILQREVRAISPLYSELELMRAYLRGDLDYEP